MIPSGPWLRLLLIALAVFAVAAMALEWQLTSKGYIRTVDDSPERWLVQRIRADALGKQALVLLGASRIQLGIDLPTLQARSGLTPIQLAIDGSSYLPILRGLAADNDFRGSVIIDYYDHTLASKDNARGEGQAYQTNFERRNLRPPGSRIEAAMSTWLHERLLAYADGGKPLDAVTRLFASERPQYLLTLPDRSRIADYRLVEMPAFYYDRVKAELGGSVVSSNAPNAAVIFAHAVESVNPDQGTFFEENAAVLKDMIARIHARGGKVYFVVMPTSGMVRDIINRRYPRSRFRDRFAAQIDVPFVVAEDVPAMRDLQCPDGSHLDGRDRVRFTDMLADQLGFTSR